MSTTVHGPGAPTPTPLHVAPDPAPPAEAAQSGEPETPTLHVDLDSPETIEQQIAGQADVLEGAVAQAIRPSADAVLFDGKPYDTLKPNVDDEDTDTAKVTISGGWDIDLNDPADVAWFNRIQRGQSVTLRIEAECTDRIAPAKRNAKDELTITGVMKLKATHVYRLTPEEL